MMLSNESVNQPTAFRRHLLNENYSIIDDILVMNQMLTLKLDDD